MTGGVHSTPLMVFDRCSYSRKSGCLRGQQVSCYAAVLHTVVFREARRHMMNTQGRKTAQKTQQ
jgi:hypothetical protein